MKILATAAFATALAFAGTAANAADIVGLYNTGVDNGGTQLAEGASDTHYVVNGTGTPVVYTNALYVSDPSAKFIAVAPGGGYTNPVNTYTLDFDLSGYDIATASLSGQFAADNFGTVELNGHLLTSLSGTLFENFEQLHPFSATAADFVAGMNTLTFTITDTGPPSAFMVADLVGTADVLGAVPEPATWAMFLLGFFGLGMMARARQDRVASAA
ncbi:MAG TPA: PEP-CTERM sorting domain-containing protein [Rhizomicrobium sp.]|nr:PEP-CTERM sorting domain-containing protein [Rhizomicrobium sp.]